MGITVEIDYDTADEITRLTLVELYQTLATTSGTIDDVPLWDAISKVLAYFSTREQLEEFENWVVPSHWVDTVFEYDTRNRNSAKY